MEVYGGRDYGFIYLCRPCKAWVGCHSGTANPMGTLANEGLRYWRNLAHASFDSVWKTGKMKRKEAYEWLAKRLGIEDQECHIAMMDESQCKQIVQLCLRERVGAA